MATKHTDGIYKYTETGEVNWLNGNYQKSKYYTNEEPETNIDLGPYGIAIEVCVEDDNGRFWVGNGEYSSQVNFCPWCGLAARVKIREVPV